MSEADATASMKAFTFYHYGGADALELRELPVPLPGPGEVLVRVQAVAINDWDWQILGGIPFVNRVSFGLRRPKRYVLGSDVAGVVEAVGADVDRFKPGDEVFGDLSGRWGGFAEYVAAAQDALVRRPAGLGPVEAAAIPQAGTLALQGLRDRGGLSPGQTLLINGAGGGVGTFGVQLAGLLGATEVTGVDSADKLDLMRSLGFDHVVDYARDDFTRLGKTYDLILDTKTDRGLSAYLRVLSPGGTYATVGGATRRLMQANMLWPAAAALRHKHVRMVILKFNKDLDYLGSLSADGKMRPVIDGPYDFADLPAAMRLFGEGGHKGKVVIKVRDDQV